MRGEAGFPILPPSKASVSEGGPSGSELRVGEGPGCIPEGQGHNLPEPKWFTGHSMPQASTGDG